MKQLFKIAVMLAMASAVLAGSPTPPYEAVVTVDSAAAKPGEAVKISVLP